MVERFGGRYDDDRYDDRANEWLVEDEDLDGETMSNEERFSVYADDPSGISEDGMEDKPYIPPEGDEDLTEAYNESDDRDREFV